MRKTVITSKLTYSSVGYWLVGHHILKIGFLISQFLTKNFQYTTCVEFEVHIRFGVKVVLHANVYEYGHLCIYGPLIPFTYFQCIDTLISEAYSLLPLIDFILYF